MSFTLPDPLIPRRAVDLARRRLRSARAIVVNGPRQCGKTALLAVLHSHSGGAYLTLDQPTNLRLARTDPTGMGMDLALTGLVPALHLGPRGMLAALLVNPVESGRILALLGGDGTSGFGTFGGYLRDSLGVTAAAGLLLTSLTAWIVTPLAAATAARTRRDL